MLHRHWCSLCIAVLVVLATVLLLAADATEPERYAGGTEGDPEEDAGMQADSPAGGRRGRKNRERAQASRQRRRQQQQQQQPQPPITPDTDDDDEDYYAQTRVLYYKNPRQQRPHEAEEEDTGGPREDDEVDYGLQYYPNTTDSADGNCSHCQYLEQIKQYKLEVLKSQILRKLRLKSPPRRPPGDLPQILNYTNLDLEPATEPSHSSDEEEAVTQKILIMGKKPPDELGLQNMNSHHLMKDNLVYFEFPDDLMHTKISNAQLGVYLRQTKSPDAPGARQSTTQLLIYRLQRNRNRRLVKELIHKKAIRLDINDTGTCHYFTFRHTVIHWLKKPRENLGLVIEAQDGEGFPLAILQPEQGDPEYGKRPLLHIKIEEDNNSRSKRMANARLDCTNGKQSPYCCRYNLVADFDLIGWDFIIQPRHYMAFFCAGDCPYSFNPASGHSTFSQAAKDNPRKNDSWIQASKNAGPCCTGVRASSLDMIYFDENEHIRFGHLKNMIVMECACA